MWNLDKIMFLPEEVFAVNGFDGQKCDHFEKRLWWTFFLNFVRTSRSSCLLIYMHVDIFVCFQKHGRISIFFNANYIVRCYANSIKSPTYLKVKHFWSFQGRPVDLSTFSAVLYLGHLRWTVLIFTGYKLLIVHNI